MVNRTEELAGRFEAVNDEIIARLSACTDEQWRQITTSEQWPVAVVGHHVAVVSQAFSGMVDKLAAGETYSPNASMDRVHQSNAEHAREYAHVGKKDVLDKLQSSGEALAQSVRNLDDEQLDRTAGVFGDRELSVAQVMEMVVIGHPADHLESLRATLQG